MARFLGIDLGTSYLKGAVLDLESGALQHQRRMPFPEPIAGLLATRCELDPGAVLGAVRELLAGLLADAPDAAGLVMCSQMHCVVLTDALGAARSNIITWKDQRVQEPRPDGAGTSFLALLERMTPAEHQRIGREARVGVPIATLFWLGEQGRLNTGDYAASLPDFVLANLCGVEPTTEATGAAAFGLMNLETGDWYRELIAKLGLSALHWPRLRPFGEAVGIANIAGRRLTCYTPIGDYQCALVGAGLTEGELSLNISTGSQVSLLSRDLHYDRCMVRPYLDGRWLHTIVQIPAGRALDLLMRLLTEIGRTDSAAAWDYVERAVDGVGATDLDVNLAFYAGALGDRGAIGNMREDNCTVGHLFVAAFRAMARNYAECARRLSSGRAWQRVVFSGGLPQRFVRLRREILAELGVAEHRLCAAKEDTLAGLLTLARRVR